MTPKTFWRFDPKAEVIKIRRTDAPKAGGVTKDQQIVNQNAKGLDEVATPADSPNNLAMPKSGDQFPLPKKDRRRIHWLVSKVTWPKSGRVNDSSTTFFGARSDTSLTTVTKLGPNEVELTNAINKMLRAATREAFQWNKLQIEVGTVGRRPGLVDAVGTCISFQHGKNDGTVEVDNGSRRCLCTRLFP